MHARKKKQTLCQVGDQPLLDVGSTRSVHLAVVLILNLWKVQYCISCGSRMRTLSLVEK